MRPVIMNASADSATVLSRAPSQSGLFKGKIMCLLLREKMCLRLCAPVFEAVESGLCHFCFASAKKPTRPVSDALTFSKKRFDNTIDHGCSELAAYDFLLN